MIRLANLLMLLALAALTGCMQAPPVRDDPAYAPVLPRTPLPQEL
ncbi:MAG: flagellar basal body L-ring protein, partial [Pseudomonadales bacterium]|nr:flagellar basal body L-ring protein [Pseudomonadales bacterium]